VGWQILESDEAQLHLMMRDYCRKTIDDIVQANFEGKKEKIIEKCRQFFPNLGEIRDSVRAAFAAFCCYCYLYCLEQYRLMNI